MTANSDVSLETKKAPKAKSGRHKQPIYRTAKSPLQKAWQDVTDGIRMSDLWMLTTTRDFINQNRRRFLGWAWVPIGMLFLVFALGYAYSYILGYDYLAFTLYLFAGFMAWTYIQSIVNGSFTLFLRDANVIMNVKMPFSYYVYRLVFLHILPIAFCLPFFLGLVALYGEFKFPEMLLFFPALLVYIICGVSMAFFIGILALRFRDLEAPIGNIMRVLFLVTPVIWMIEGREGSKRAYWAEYNPLYHIVEIMRAPLLGKAPEPINWYVSLGVMGFLFLCAIIIFPRYRHRIAYWL